MKDETFELLTKMYADFSNRFDKVEVRLDSLESNQKELKSGQVKLESILEHDVKNNIQLLHERSAGNTEKLDEHTKKLENINNQLDYLTVSVNAQDKRLTVVESMKKKAK